MIGHGVIGVELDGAVVIGNRAIGLALGAIGHAAIEIGQRIVRIELDRRIQARNGVLVIALVVIDMTERIERHRVLDVVFDRLFEILQCAVDLAAIAERKTAFEQRVGVLRIDLDRFVEIANGVVAVVLGAIGLAARDQCRCLLLLFDFRLVDDRGAADDALIGRDIVFAHARLFNGCGKRVLRGEQHDCRSRRADADSSRSPVHTASSTRFGGSVPGYVSVPIVNLARARGRGVGRCRVNINWCRDFRHACINEIGLTEKSVRGEYYLRAAARAALAISSST